MQQRNKKIGITRAYTNDNTYPSSNNFPNKSLASTANRNDFLSPNNLPTSKNSATTNFKPKLTKSNSSFSSYQFDKTQRQYQQEQQHQSSLNINPFSNINKYADSSAISLAPNATPSMYSSYNSNQSILTRKFI
jgi:hypothetical protein